jgi:geranylgeranyl pyrophosphate synthase
VAELNDAVVAMGAGQAIDLALMGSDRPAVESVAFAATLKGSALLGALARMAARVAGSPAGDVSAFGRYGEAIGLADQLRGDWADVGQLSYSKDLASGARTLPIALSLSEDTLEHHPVRALRGSMRLDPSAQLDASWHLLGEASRSRYTAGLAACRGAAMQAVAELRLRKEWAMGLQEIIRVVCNQTGGSVPPPPLRHRITRYARE